MNAQMPGSHRNGRYICVDTHRVTECQHEMDCDVPPDHSRTFGPKPKRLTPLQRAIATALGSFIAWAVLVSFGSQALN